MAQLLQNALYGTALILAALLLRQTLRNRLIPEARLCLWGACLLRLLTPASPKSALSLWGLFPAPVSDSAPAPTPQFYTSAPAPAAAAPVSAGFSWKTALGLVWLAVGLILAVRYALSWVRTWRAVRCAIPLERDDPRYALLPKCARLREGVMEGAPLTFGALRPTVVLSPGLKGTALECVLAHEGVHASRRDNLWHYVTALALTVHWWNPAVWLMARLLRRDIELACDRAALKRLGADRRGDYARALVSLSTQGEGPAFSNTFGQKLTEERILSIMKFKKTTAIGAIFALILVLAVTAAFASQPRVPRGAAAQSSTAVAPDPAPTQSVGMTAQPEKTKDIQSDFPEISPDDVDLAALKKQLDQKVADGKLTQAQADQSLAGTEEMLEKARRGELKLFLYDNGQGESWPYGIGAFSVNGETQSRFLDPCQILQPLYYEDENGELVPVDPDTVENGYVLVTDTPVEMPDDAVPVISSALGEANISYDEGKTVQNEEIPPFVPDYDPAVEDSIPETPAPEVAALCPVAGCTIEGVHAHNGVNYCGHVVVSAPSATPGLCPVAGCTVAGVHAHNGVNYCGHAASSVDPATLDLCPVAGCTIEGVHAHNGMNYCGHAASSVDPATLDLCPVAGCTIAGVHAHNGVNYCGHAAVSAPSATPAPVPANPGTPIVCPVAGCTIRGTHTHNGVTYLCNGAHCGGVCDGSCAGAAWNQAGTSQTAPQPGSGYGHHGAGHHGGWHH